MNGTYRVEISEIISKIFYAFIHWTSISGLQKTPAISLTASVVL